MDRRMKNTGAASDTGAVLLFLLIVVILVYWWLSNSHRARVRQERLAQLSRDADAWVARVAHGMMPIATRLMLKDGEHALLEESSTLLESRSYRVYGGAGTRIGGVYVGGGASESQQRLKQIDTGTITLTTKRLIFDGSLENRTVQVSQVLSVSPWVDGFEVSTERRAKSQVYLVANPLIWTAAIKAVAAGAFTVRQTHT